MYNCFEIDSTSFATVLEYCNGTDLESYLSICGVLNEREAKCIIMQLFSALKYLSELKNPVIHYDVKPSNILIDRGEIKLSDFGLSKLVVVNEDEFKVNEILLTSQGAGTYYYLPPESLNRTAGNLISGKIDVWSAACVFFEMYFWLS